MFTHLLLDDEGHPEVTEVEKIRDINSVITTFKLNIEKVIDEDDGQVYYAMVNLADGNLSRSSTLRPKTHLELFKRVLNAIMTNEERCISETELINLHVDIPPLDGPRKKLSLTEAERLMEQWIKARLLSKDKNDGRITLGVSGVAQFRQMIQNDYPTSYETCFICVSFCLRGQRCKSCAKLHHRHCLNQMRSVNSSQQEVCCSNCHTPL